MKTRTLVLEIFTVQQLALLQVLERAQASVNDRFVFLGDYVDGWSQSYEVVDFLIDFKKTHDCSFIKGNHDAWCEQWLTKNIVQERWFNNGGEASMKSYANISPEKKQEHISFFAALLNYYTDDKKRLFIHAGFAHTKSIDSIALTRIPIGIKLYGKQHCLDKNIPYDWPFTQNV